MDTELLIAPLDSVALKRVAVVVCGVSFFLRFMTGGWGILVGFIPYILICLVHYGIHRHVANQATPITRSLIWLFLLSDLFLFSAFLLQYDEGDGPGWLTLTAFFGWRFSGTILNEYGFFYDLLVFIPVLITWGLMVLKSKSAWMM